MPTIIIGDTLTIIGFIFIGLGMIGVFRFKDFFSRILVVTKIDTVGAIVLVAGQVVKHGAEFFSLKLLLVLATLLLLNPLSTHIVARSAYISIGDKLSADGMSVAMQNKLHDDGKTDEGGDSAE